MDFSEHGDLTPIRTQRIPQNIETPVSFVPVPNAYVRYAYSRSSDSMASQIEGQDYLCFQHNDQKLDFEVCDGVGSSFCGNLAARILGDNLLEWLWLQDVPRMGSGNALAEATTAYLNKLQKQAQYEVLEYDIPDHISGLIRQALESQRAYGSEAIFAACRIDYPCAAIPEGLIAILWMGDTRIRVFGDDGSEIDLGGEWINGNRWSTVHGARGQMYAWMSPLAGISRVMAFTDGLGAHYGGLPVYGDTQLDSEIRAGSKLPTSDDVAFIEVVLRTPLYEGYPEGDIPDPNAERPHLEPVWNPTGASTYTVRWNWPIQNRAGFIIQEGRSPALTDALTVEAQPGALEWQPSRPQAPGWYYYRVRAVTRRGTTTPWSELRQTRVAFPPPQKPVLSVEKAGSITTLHWPEAGDSVQYVVQQSQTEDFTESDTVFEGRASSWRIPSGTRPGIYWYRVFAISDGGESLPSEPQSVEVIVPPPPRPHLGTIQYESSHGVYLLRWQAVVGATLYEIEETESGRDEPALITSQDTTCSIHIDERQPGEYTYRIRACHDYACSEWSNGQVLIITPPAPEYAPVPHVILDPDMHTVRLEWGAVEYATSYTVEVASDEAFSMPQHFTRQECLLELPAPDPGQRFYRVCAENSGGSGPWSESATITVLPDAPSWVEASAVAAGLLTLNWGGVRGATLYRVETVPGDQDEAHHHEVYAGDQTRVEYRIPGGGGTFVFRVRAEAPGVVGPWQVSDPLTVSTTLGTPHITDLRPDERGSIDLRWDAVEGATHYIIEISLGEIFETVIRRLHAAQAEAAFAPSTGSTYWFRVRACIGDVSGPASKPLSLMVSQAAAPVLLPVNLAQRKRPFEITWRAVEGVSRYELQQSPGVNFADALTTTHRRDRGETRQEITAPEKGRLHFRVRALDERGQPGYWSETITVEVT
ncbi:MAG: protein phosphatase 2C domain-containing protein [Anaerolineae bacterium]|nr:protein phosphatase 2C domain-containing protein [Anaerolineae bacterium]